MSQLSDNYGHSVVVALPDNTRDGGRATYTQICGMNSGLGVGDRLSPRHFYKRYREKDVSIRWRKRDRINPIQQAHLAPKGS